MITLPTVDGYKVACVSCEHYDRDGYCALPTREQLITGYIREPLNVVCERYELRDGIEAEYQARFTSCGHTYGTEVPCPQCPSD